MKITFEAKIEDDEGKIVASISGGSEYNKNGQCQKAYCNNSSLGTSDKAKTRAKNLIRTVIEVIYDGLVFRGKKD